MTEGACNLIPLLVTDARHCNDITNATQVSEWVYKRVNILNIWQRLRMLVYVNVTIIERILTKTAPSNKASFEFKLAASNV